MYMQILKKDLRRKKTMNLILFVFIVLAATFIAGSVNNMVSVMTALDTFFEKARVPDRMICFSDEKDARRFAEFAEQEQIQMLQQEALQIDPKNLYKDSGSLEYNNTVLLARIGDSIRIFGGDDKEVTQVADGSIYLSVKVTEDEGLRVQDAVRFEIGGKSKELQVAGSVKDALFASEMTSMTRIFVSDADYAYFDSADAAHMYLTCVYTEDEAFTKKLRQLGLNVLMDIGKEEIRLMYVMDMVTAAVMLVVSICLILISMVILRFTILFTMSEEFREIGVMKAIGIPDYRIRGLYIVKYFAISLVGGGLGLVCSIPFGKLMLKNLSHNIMIEADGNLLWNVLCAVVVVAVVVLFSYSCTRKMKKFSPIDAIRNGENGERFARKSALALHSSRLPAVLYLALNDILSGIRRYAALILIFTIGILLVVIPVNTIHTLQSDQLITWFSMAPCDHVISKEQLFHADDNNRRTIVDHLNEVKSKLSEHGVKAQVYQEVLFRMNIAFQDEDEKETSLAFQGVGDVTADQYVYLEGSAPRDHGEVGISHLIADRIGAHIGDTVTIQNGEAEGKYLVTAVFQTMNNLGEGIRFYEEEKLDYRYIFGSFGIQLRYTDEPGGSERKQRIQLLQELFPEYEVYTAGEYINEMIGDVSGQLQGVKYLILAVVLCINMLVSVLMVKSFLTKEKGEIAMLKAMGFQNGSLAVWQTLRIGIVLLLATILGALCQAPLSQLLIGPIFRMMGAQNITFEVRPLEVYVLYPLLVFVVTVCASLLTALQVRRISVMDASNVE